MAGRKCPRDFVPPGTGHSPATLRSLDPRGEQCASIFSNQRYTLAIDFSTLAGAQRQLEATNAFRDAQQADAEGIRLVLP